MAPHVHDHGINGNCEVSQTLRESEHTYECYEQLLSVVPWNIIC